MSDIHRKQVEEFLAENGHKLPGSEYNDFVDALKLAKAIYYEWFQTHAAAAPIAIVWRLWHIGRFKEMDDVSKGVMIKLLMGMKPEFGNKPDLERN